MHILVTNLNSLWKVTAVGLLLGAGLPTIFAIGVRAWSASEAVPADGGGGRRNFPALAVALMCLVLVVGVIIAGILYTARAFIAARFGIHLFGYV
ncbi:hypothetical protein AB0B25_12445 [Nocardia sp. NPDC049190]|uniref:hypothetical protein n=1 Tax=Nocardia sp. NPDC049190 TaxID=3155650 RepID=UPI0033EB43E7